eukprot:5490780-Pyramimonas_sp.AAC.1
MSGLRRPWVTRVCLGRNPWKLHFIILSLFVADAAVGARMLLQEASEGGARLLPALQLACTTAQRFFPAVMFALIGTKRAQTACVAVCFGSCDGFTVTTLRGLRTAIENAQANADAARVITLGASLELDGQ